MEPEESPSCCLNRRDFLALAASAALAASFQGVAAAASSDRVIDAGPLSAYAADGVYPAFRDNGFFIVKKDGKFFALSSMCTHRRCKIKAEPDRSFYCPCHGSTFTPGGKVTKGPAKADLPVYAAEVNEKGRLMVHLPTA